MAKSIGSGERERLLLVAGAIGVLAYGWWFTDRQPFSRGALFAILVAVGVLLALAALRRARTPSSPPDTARGEASRLRSAVVVWSAVSAAGLSWELIAFRSLPRAAHPTISSIIESADQYHLARLGLFALWLGLGWTLAS